MSHFKIINRRTGGEDRIKLEKDSIVLGRQAGVDILLDSKTVSRKHAEVLKIDEDHFIVDLESGNGTFLNGRKLKPNEKALLKNSDIIRIEEFEIRPTFPTKKEVEPEENTDAGILDIRILKKVLSAIDADRFPSLEILTPPHEGKRILFSDDIDELVIGRDKGLALSIDSSTISRRHAILKKKWGGITISDNKSKNGVFVNGIKVEERILKDGDIILVGEVKLAFHNPHEIDLEALSREYEKKEKDAENTEDEREQKQKQEQEQKKEAEQADISAQAMASLGNEKEKKKETPEPKKEEPDEKEELPAPPLKKMDQILGQIKSIKPADISTFLTRFSTSELILLGGGLLFFVATLIIFLRFVF